jgi:hypothetical protein
VVLLYEGACLARRSPLDHSSVVVLCISPKADPVELVIYEVNNLFLTVELSRTKSCLGRLSGGLSQYLVQYLVHWKASEVE